MPMSLFKNNKKRNKVVNPYYAISELEQNKQNNTTIFFSIYFFNKKVDLSSLRGGGGGVRAHPSHPPSLRAWNW